MADAVEAPRSTLGWIGFATGSVALVLTILIFWAGPFAPQQDVGVGLGELVADIAKSAARSVAGQPQPAALVPTRDIDDYLRIGVGVLAGLSIILGVAALVRYERKRAAISGIALGGLAVGFQLFAWMMMLFVGGLVICAVIYTLRDAFGDMLGGLFGG